MKPKIVLTLLAALVLLPSAASASPTQMSILQDDATFVFGSGRDPEAAMAEAKAIGADAIRVFVTWHSVSPGQDSRRRPAGFDAGDPDSPGYQWGMYDAVVDRARRNGLKVLMVLSPSIPYCASEQP